MVDCLIRQIHIQLEENESWSGADYVSPELKVLLDASEAMLVRCSPRHSPGVSSAYYDEPFLRLGTGCLDCTLPKPLIKSNVNL